MEMCLNIGKVYQMSMKSQKMTFFTIFDKITPVYDPRDTPLDSLKF